jgi:hypothetical protein
VLSGGGTGGRDAGVGAAGNGAVCSLNFEVLGVLVSASNCSPSNRSAAAKYTLCSTLTDLFAGYTWCPCDLMSKLIQQPSHAHGLSLEPVGSCTHTASLKHFKHDRSGGVPYNACQGVMPPSTHVDIQFLNHVEWCNASPHMFGGRAAMCSNARIPLPRVQFRCSTMPFSLGVSWTVS